jgi:glycosyltransferase involved in cell wall biosynthesis
VKIAFYANRMFLEGDYLSKVGTGGSESALINMTRTWKKNYPDDEIVIFNGNTIRNNEYEGVKYKSNIEFKNEIILNQWDAFISLRETQPFLKEFINAKIKCVWSQDDMNEHDLQVAYEQKYIRANIDLFFVISNHSKNSISKAFSEKEFVLLRNGYNKELANPVGNRKPIAIYTSTPFRGLDVLKDVWQDIYYGSGNEPELRIFSGMSLYRQNDDQNLRNLYNELTCLPNVYFHEPVNQFQLYKELQQAKVMLYPNHFLETGCMAVTEALANGVWTITTNLGALGEQVKEGINGNLIYGDSHSPEYKDKFVEKAINYFKNPKTPVSEGLVFSWDEQSELMRKSIQERIN